MAVEDSRNFRVTTPSDITRRLPCVSCEGVTVHGVLAVAAESGSAADDQIQWWTSHELVQCKGCEEVSYRRAHQNTEDQDWDRDGNPVLTVHEELFPRRVSGRKSLPDLYSLPPTVRRVYEDTHGALNNEFRVLSGIGIRALVESVCKEKKAPGRNLEKKIDGLVTLGLLTQAGAEILHGTRLLGNTAAHEQKPLDMTSLNAAMQVAEHLINTVYVLPSIAESLPRRKAAGGKGAS